MEDLVAFAARRLSTRWAGHPLVIKASTASTNDDARAAAIAGAPQGYAVLADTQTAGRGRRGHAWHSPAGANIYASLVVRPMLAVAHAPVITLAAGLAVADAIQRHVESTRVTIKWPNDVRIGLRKVAGVLVEGSLRGDSLAFAVIGIGINVRDFELPGSIARSAITLERAVRTHVERATVLGALFEALESRLDALFQDGPNATVRDVTARCDTIGTQVRIDDVAGVALRIAASGGLVVRGEDGVEHEVRAGELLPRT